MTLRVQIQRTVDGHLHAWVYQAGRRGDNLLKGRTLSSVETAKTEILRKLAGHEIQFEVQE